MTDGYDGPRWDEEDEDDDLGGSGASDERLAPAAVGEGDEDDDLGGSGASDERLAPAAVGEGDEGSDDLDRSSENVLEPWPEPVDEVRSAEDALVPVDDDAPAELPAADPVALRQPLTEAEYTPSASEHAPGELVLPPGIPVLEGNPRGERRAVGIVVGRFNGDVTTRMLESALAELAVCGVTDDAITVMPVPGAFELPLAAMALAKTRRFACIVALGCVIRGDTPHFDYVASEAASGLQLAAIETGVPVAFGLLTLDRADQADARVDKGAEAVRTALEMADLFANLRAAAAR